MSLQTAIKPFHFNIPFRLICVNFACEYAIIINVFFVYVSTLLQFISPTLHIGEQNNRKHVLEAAFIKLQKQIPKREKQKKELQSHMVANCDLFAEWNGQKHNRNWNTRNKKRLNRDAWKHFVELRNDKHKSVCKHCPCFVCVVIVLIDNIYVCRYHFVHYLETVYSFSVKCRNDFHFALVSIGKYPFCYVVWWDAKHSVLSL